MSDYINKAIDLGMGVENKTNITNIKEQLKRIESGHNRIEERLTILEKFMHMEQGVRKANWVWICIVGAFVVQVITIILAIVPYLKP